MTLKDYYKKQVFEYGYNCGWLDRKASPTERPRKNTERDLFYKDEEDYYICCDYYSSYVGDKQDWTQEDIEFLNALGFSTGDFKQD